MSPWLRGCALGWVLLSPPAVAGPPREDRHAARIRPSSPRPEPEVPPSEAVPIAAAAADAGGVDLAGFFGMATALAATYVYARGRRLSTEQTPIRPAGGLEPPDRR